MLDSPIVVGGRTLDTTDASVHPADVNAHTHLYSGLAPLGMPAPTPPPENFVQILERVWWRLDRALDARSLEAAARLYVAQALLHGTTTLVDHHESPGFIEGSLDVLADACASLGMRALLCYGATERNGGLAEGRRGVAECRRFIETNQRPGIIGAVALHASFTVGDDVVREAGRLCAELAAPMHVHLAEDGADVVDAKARGYDGPLERLVALGALPSGSVAAHGVHLTRDQVRRAADLGVWFVHNPRSNEGNRVGYAGSLAATGRAALGTDGYPADMEAEEQALVRIGAIAGDSTEALAARRGASRAMGRALFGDGIDGDIVVRNADGTTRHVVSQGRLIVLDGTLQTGDIDTIVAAARQAADPLWERMAAL